MAREGGEIMNRRSFLLSFSSGALLAGLTHPARADSGLSNDEVVDIIFDEVERVIIEEYFGLGSHDQGGHGKNKNKNKGLPPGLAKREQLPPGLAKQVQRNGTLPPGLAMRALPGDLVYQLPAPYPGTERVIVGSDVVLIRAGTRYILDVIKDVVTQ